MHDAYAQLIEQSINVRTICEKHPNDHELFRTIFGNDPKGKVEVVRGPWMLHFRAGHIHEYARQRFATTDLSDTQLQKAKKSGGFFSQRRTFTQMGLGRAVAMENNQDNHSFTGSSVPIYLHEERHAINSYFHGADVYPISKPAHFTYGKPSNPFRTARYHIGDCRAKDELLAFAAGGDRTLEETQEVLLRPQGLYDYFAEAHAQYEPKVRTRDRDQLAEMFLSMRSEYEGIVKSAVNAMVILEHHDLDYETMVELLMLEPLETWKPLAESVVELRG